ncbi:polysaccharide deacetylase family protein [Thermomonospora cellulosilytica]|uniref:Peptidoglycan/xylan/chitin deacetylase (PgdA/CDA1 family) n=1 Tax=Thermomonospora cellulosilytica TaxID=1411118 RepID=A0A7W3N398_9ACTN|nr:polysaccharide deacetylase family protein [Thermomonospora cellulosilytica]MBA9006730.1 peptidoglycan/xylan/chitin deacetylase (PgdA/CDA1 family) [Thermomonospora cellulosilytica]
MRRALHRLASSSTALAAAAALLVAASPSGHAAAPGHARSQCPNGYVALTFDDGPTPATLPTLLSRLREAGARATFFNQGDRSQARPDLVRAQRSAGMWIGNHTVTHPHLTQIGEPAAFQEILGAQQILHRITGEWPTLFRPPYGETNEQIRRHEARLGLLEVLWTVDSRDWAGATTAEIVAAARTLRPGGIMLMHDWSQASVDAVPQIVRELRARGLCTGRIVYTPQDVPFGDTVFHAVATAP